MRAHVLCKNCDTANSRLRIPGSGKIWEIFMAIDR